MTERCFFEKTNVLRFPRENIEEKKVQIAINEAKEYFVGTSIYIYPVLPFGCEYLKGIDFYTVIGHNFFPIRVLSESGQLKYLINRGIEVIIVKKNFSSKELSEKIIKKISRLFDHC